MSYRFRDFGSYTVGGRTVEVRGQPTERIQFTPTTAYERDPNGTHVVEQAYVQYFVPEQRRNSDPPVLLVHGGGMTGAMWETTPDGRPGWLHLLLDRGHEVHVVDNVERGRAGWHPGLWDGEPVVRTLEEAWTLFRIGPASGFATRTPFAGQRFPAVHFDGFCRSFVPRWVSTLPAQARAFGAVLKKLGTAHVICHSQGAQVVFAAAAEHAQNIQRVTALEPSGLPHPETKRTSLDVDLVVGDWIDIDEFWRDMIHRCRAYTNSGVDRVTWFDLAQHGLPRHSHMMMMDEGSAEILSLLLD